MTRALDIVVFGLTLSSSWGNGHATTWRSLLRGLAAAGHRVLFLEHDQPWYAAHRDLPDPGFCDFALYDDIPAVLARHADRLARADAVIVGSYVPDAVLLTDLLLRTCERRLYFYDIDTPVTLGHLACGDAPYLARRHVPRFNAILSFAAGPALDLLTGRFGAQAAVPLYCSVDAGAYRPLAVPLRWDLGYLGTHSNDRLSGLDELLLAPARARPDLRFVVAGSGYPADIDWPANVERIEHLPPGRHPAFYAAQRFTLNLTRAPMRRLGYCPSVRLFEAAACGVPVISDRWRGLDELFPEDEAILIAEGTADLLAALAFGDARRRAIGAAARRIVLAGHTCEARAADLVAALLHPTAQPAL